MARSIIAALSLLAVVAVVHAQSRSFDIIVRGGTILDGLGGTPYEADLGISTGAIAAIGDLRGAAAAVDLDARGLYVAPGFINIHSHASAPGLPRAANMLTQGVTTEIINPDGFGPADISTQMATLARPGLAVNIGAYIGFNAVWQAVMGTLNRRPTDDDVTGMRGLVERGLEHGAWGVSAGLDYVPGRYARTDEIIRVLGDLRKWRTNFPNHERLTEASNFSGEAGIAETLAIARAAGLMPVITHVKADRRKPEGAAAVIAMMTTATSGGLYTAADVYPYVAGQTFLSRLLIPAWAQEGGRADMLRRFADATTRARIVAETDRVLVARFGGPEAVYLPAVRRELVDVMRADGVGAGEAIVRLVEQRDPPAILRFGVERDVVAFLQHPPTSIACDCGAIPSGVPGVHPRFFGTYPRVLGRYVREQQALTWPQAIRKMTALPAATIGMVDRGILAVGMAADVTVFDPQRVIDRATYEDPAQPSEGIRHVVVNGRVALRAGQLTGERAGAVLVRTPHMPSRQAGMRGTRRVFVRAAASDARRTPGSVQELTVELDVQQDADGRHAKGVFRVREGGNGVAVEALELGILQVDNRWATFSGRARVTAAPQELPFRVVVDQDAPFRPGGVVWVLVPGVYDATVPLTGAHVYLSAP